jgi:hypothetical protein
LIFSAYCNGIRVDFVTIGALAWFALGATTKLYRSRMAALYTVKRANACARGRCGSLQTQSYSSTT